MEDNKVMCPLMSLRDPAMIKTVVHCQREKCAWWVEDRQKCAVTVLGSKK